MKSMSVDVAVLCKHKFKVIIAGMCKISACDASNG